MREEEKPIITVNLPIEEYSRLVGIERKANEEKEKNWMDYKNGADTAITTVHHELESILKGEWKNYYTEKLLQQYTAIIKLVTAERDREITAIIETPNRIKPRRFWPTRNK